jgi:hypothetical protein
MLLLLASQVTVGVGVVEADVESELSCSVAKELGAAIEARTELQPRTSCRGAVDAADEQVELRIFGAITRMRVNAKRGDRRGFVELELPRGPPKLWSKELDGLARVLFPEGGAVRARVEQDEEPAMLPWVILGVGAVAALTGSVFAISSLSARSDLGDPGLPPNEFDPLFERMNDHARAANVFFVSSLVVGAAGVVALSL